MAPGDETDDMLWSPEHTRSASVGKFTWGLGEIHARASLLTCWLYVELCRPSVQEGGLLNTALRYFVYEYFPAKSSGLVNLNSSG